MGFASFVGLLHAIPAGASSFLCPLVFAFRVRRFSLLLAFFLSGSVFCVSPCSLWISSQFFHILHLRRLFTLMLLLFSSVLQVLLGNPSVVRVLLPCVSAGFLSYSCHSLLRFFLVPQAAFPPFVAVSLSACCGALHSGFGSFSAGPALLCCCGFWLSLF